jgi:hypothetical protein
MNRPVASTEVASPSGSTSRSKSNRRRGAAAVEMALCAPVLFILIFGMIDIGRALMVQHLLTNAARDGARAAILEGGTAEGITGELVSYLALCSVPNANVTVSPDPLDTADIGDPVTVTCTVPFDDVSWLPTSKYLAGQTLSATVIMRRETVSSNAITEN